MIKASDTTHGSVLFLSIHSTGEVLEHDSMGLQCGVSDLLEVLNFEAAPLTRLSISGVEDNAPVGGWNQLFTSFSALEILTLSPTGPRACMATFWAALRGSGGADADADSTTVIPCPRLSHLELGDGFIMPPGLFTQMLNCLEWGMEGGSRLGYLQLDDLMNRDDSRPANTPTDDLDLPRLQSLVDELAI